MALQTATYHRQPRHPYNLVKLHAHGLRRPVTLAKGWTRREIELLLEIPSEGLCESKVKRNGEQGIHFRFVTLQTLYTCGMLPLNLARSALLSKPEVGYVSTTELLSSIILRYRQDVFHRKSQIETEAPYKGMRLSLSYIMTNIVTGAVKQTKFVGILWSQPGHLQRIKKKRGDSRVNLRRKYSRQRQSRDLPSFSMAP